MGSKGHTTPSGNYRRPRPCSTVSTSRWRRKVDGTRISKSVLSNVADIVSVENHDQPRIVSRMGSDHPAERTKSAKMTAMFHTSLTGTIFIYQGQEIGLCNVPRDWAEEEYKDIETIQALDGERDFRWKQNGKKGKPEDIDVSDVMQGMRWTARDNGRTPMQVSKCSRKWMAKLIM